MGISFCYCHRQKEVSVSDFSSEFIFKDKTTTNCHASTIVELNNHNLMAAWFGGTYEGAKDVGIYTSIYNGENWTKAQCLIPPMIKDNDTLPCWNPVLYISKSNQLYLFYKIGKNPREWFGAMIKSYDMGKTWGKPEILPNGILGPIKNKPVEIENGIIICGSSTEKQDGTWRVHVEQYNELGNKWKIIPVLNTNNFDVIQPTFLKHPDNKLQMLCRSKHNCVISSWSTDMGNTWSNLDTLSVPNSNSGIDAITVDKDLFLMVNNPLMHGAEWYNGRNLLDVEYSQDGIHWKKLIDLENQDKGQFSYPAIIQSSDKKIHIVYTYNRDYIKHVSFSVR